MVVTAIITTSLFQFWSGFHRDLFRILSIFQVGRSLISELDIFYPGTLRLIVDSASFYLFIWSIRVFLFKIILLLNGFWSKVLILVLILNDFLRNNFIIFRNSFNNLKLFLFCNSSKWSLKQCDDIVHKIQEFV